MINNKVDGKEVGVHRGKIRTADFGLYMTATDADDVE